MRWDGVRALGCVPLEWTVTEAVRSMTPFDSRSTTQIVGGNVLVEICAGVHSYVGVGGEHLQAVAALANCLSGWMAEASGAATVSVGTLGSDVFAATVTIETTVGVVLQASLPLETLARVYSIHNGNMDCTGYALTLIIAGEARLLVPSAPGAQLLMPRVGETMLHTASTGETQLLTIKAREAALKALRVFDAKITGGSDD